MKNLILMIALTLTTVVGINAQTKEDNTEVYIGYQFLRTNVETRSPSLTFDRKTDSHGVNVSVTEYVPNRAVGFTGEVGANFDGNGRNLYTFMGGLTLKGNRKGKVQPFVRGLAGAYVAQNQTFNSRGTKTDFSYAAGGGLDVKFKKVGVRVIQVDYLGTRNYNQFDNNIRFSTGLFF